MEEIAFDTALLAAAFEIAAEQGWGRTSPAAAAQRAGLRLDEARLRFRGRVALLLRFGRLADAYALEGAASTGATRDRLFDLIMRRIDFLQRHRDGVLAVLHALPTEPPTVLLLAEATRRSMAWMLEAAGIPATGLAGKLRTHGAVAIWLWTLRAWRSDFSEDLSATMAALDKALDRAERAASWLERRKPAPADEPPTATPEAEPQDTAPPPPAEA